MRTEEKLMGPRAHEREHKLQPEEVQLEDGRPLYHALLADPEALVLSPDEAREAKQRLSQMIAANLDKVLTCQGKTLKEARAILESIEVKPGK